MVLYLPIAKHKNTIGGKAEGLVRLANMGLNVPPFVVLPAENFETFITAGENDTTILYERLRNYKPEEKDLHQIKSILDKWKARGYTVIVRSSVAGEDGKDDAFAGIMETFANLHTLTDVVDAVAQCAASAFSPRAVAYKKEKGLSLSARPAVIVQQQIVATASGVVFSTYPTYPTEMAIHAVAGLGEGLVSGLFDADEYYLLKKTGAINRQKIVVKETMIVPGIEKGTQQQTVPLEDRDKPCLSNDMLQQVFDAATLIEKTIGQPQDIEFVVAGTTLFFVQSRPITQPIPEVVVYDNSNIQESYCGVTTPLTFTFARRAYATVYTQTMEILSLPPKQVEAYAPVVNNLLGLVKGRIYYNINNWYRGLQLLPSFKQNKADMERMMGVEEPVDFVVDREKTMMEKLRLLPSLLVNLLRLLKAFSGLEKRVDHFLLDFKKHYEAFYQLENKLSDPSAIVAQKKLLDSTLLERWTTPIINDFYVMMMNGRVRRRLIAVGIANPEEFLSRYFAGNQVVASAQPAFAMQALAKIALADRGLHELIIQSPPKVHERVRKINSSFYNEVQNFISLYGDRTVGELKLETVTMRLEPAIFYNYLKNYLLSPHSIQVAAHTNLHNQAKLQLEQALQNRLPFFRKRILNALQKLQQAVQFREAMRLERTRLFGMYRTLYLAAGKVLVAKGVVQSARDIFYVEESEIEHLLQSDSSIVAAVIGQRKKLFEQYRNEDVPARVIVPSPPFIDEHVVPNDKELRGTGCVPGIVSGEVIVIKDPSDPLDVSGKIICALRTDPGWVTLFPACKGVLIEKGSALSHSVILLREFGIPAIINIQGLTKILTSGTHVTINGQAGTVSIEEQ